MLSSYTNYQRVPPCVPTADYSCVSSTSAQMTQDMKFLGYIAKYGKSFTTSNEFQKRKTNWQETDDWLTNFQATNSSFTVGHNKFSDWSAEDKK